MSLVSRGLGFDKKRNKARDSAAHDAATRLADPYSLESASRHDADLGTQAEDDYFQRARSFDPSAALARYAEGATAASKSLLSDSLRDLTGSAVGAGRLDTGFFDEDRGQVVRQVQGDLNNDLLGASLQTTQMERANTSELGQFGMAKRTEFADLLSGILDRATADKNSKRQAKSGMIGGIANGVLNGAAMLFGK